MNLNWINEINLLHKQQRKELELYYEKRFSFLQTAIENAHRIKQNSCETAKKIMLEEFNKYER